MPTPKDQEEAHPLRKALLRTLIPLSVDAITSYSKTPLAVKLVLPSAVSAGMAAYDAPEGEKLLRAGTAVGGSLLGSTIGALGHRKLKTLIQPAMQRELAIPDHLVDRDSTIGGRMALQWYSDDGRVLLGLAGGVAGRAAANAIADYFVKKPPKEEDA